MNELQSLAWQFWDIGLPGMCDIAIVTLVIYTFLVALKRTRRSGLIFLGLIIVSAVYLLARKFNLGLTVSLLQGFFTVFLVAIVVIFQEDLRYFFERVALWWLERGTRTNTPARLSRRESEILARTLADMARLKIGALVVIRGKDAVVRHLDGGTEVKGKLSEPLLRSIFDPHSQGHDGAVIVDGPLVDHLGCYLPLSQNLDKLTGTGTRHAAGLGLSERCDALCLIVSEERGTISIARHGELTPIASANELLEQIEAFYDEITPKRAKRPVLEFFGRNSREKILALAIAMALWFVMEHRAQQPVQRTYDVPVSRALLPSNMMITNISPMTVKVTLSGPRLAATFLQTNEIKLILNLWDSREGHSKYRISTRDLVLPQEFDLKDIEPRELDLDLIEKP